jgi:aldehyde dehydrogenase (NAD+)
MISETIASILINKLLDRIKDNKELLYQRNVLITNDTEYTIKKDYNYVCQYLENFNVKQTLAQNCLRKERGRILILLSYNEPFILTIIPILNALIAGNSVVVRPSSKSHDFFKSIWLDPEISQHQSLPLTIETRTVASIYEDIKNFDSVYFFGSHEHARELANECGKQYVSFHPEVEGSDTKVVLINQPEKWSLVDDARSTFIQSITHAGQSCQRIHGVFVPTTFYKKYIQVLRTLVKDEALISEHIRTKHQIPLQQKDKLEADIINSEPRGVYRGNHGLPIIIDSPSWSSELVYKAYFIPTLWVIPYHSNQETIQHLNTRRYRLGLNIVGKNEEEIQEYLEKTRYSRYTVNCSHTDIRYEEGWGGLNPTGFHGYQNWINHFSYPIAIIK